MTFLSVGPFLILSPVRAAEAEADLYFSATALYNRGLYKLAADEFRQFLSRHGGHEKAGAAEFGLAMALYGAGELAEARPRLEKLARSAPDEQRREALVLWGRCLLADEKADEAAAAFRDAHGRAGGDVALELRALEGWMDAEHARGNWEEVVTRAGEAAARAAARAAEDPAAKPREARARYLRANALLQLEKPSDAVMELDAALRLLQPREPDTLAGPALLLLGEARRSQNDPDGAVRAYDEAASLGGTNAAEALLRTAYVRAEQGRLDEAARAASKLEADFPESPLRAHAAIYVGKAAAGKGDTGRAQTTLRPLVQHEEVGAEAAYWLGRALAAEGKEAEAIPILHQGAQRFPDDPRQPDLRFEHASLLRATDKPAEAAEAFSTLADAAPDSPVAADALRKAAECWLDAGRPADALAAAARFRERFKEGDPAQPGHAARASVAAVAFSEAEAAFQQDDLANAAPGFRKVLDSFGDQPKALAARFRLGQCHFRQEEWPAARETLEKVADDGGAKDAAFFLPARFLAGIAAHRAGDHAKAEALLSRFLSENPAAADGDVALLTLAAVREGRSDSNKATEALDRLVSGFPESPHRARALAEAGRLRAAAGDAGGARSRLERVLREFGGSPWRVDAGYLLGDLEAEAGNHAVAAQRFAEAADAGGDHRLAGPARLREAAALRAVGDEPSLKKAEAALDRFVRDAPAHPQVPAARLTMAELARGRGDPEAALRHLREVVGAAAIDPAQRSQALYQLAWAEREAGRPDAARDAYARLLADAPDSALAPAAAVESAELAVASAKPADARATLAPWLDRLGDAAPALKARAWSAAGEAHRDEENLLEAAKAFESAAGVGGDAPPDVLQRAAFLAGEARLGLKEFAAAAGHFERAAETTAEGTDTLRNQALVRAGEAWAMAGDWGRSRGAYQGLLGASPEGEFGRQAQFGLGWAAENSKDYAAAVGHYNQAIAPEARDLTGARSQFQIGECHFAAGQFDDAIKAYIKVEANYGFPEWTARALLEIGRVQERQGDLEGAAARYREVQDRFPESDTARVAADLAKALGG